MPSPAPVRPDHVSLLPVGAAAVLVLLAVTIVVLMRTEPKLPPSPTPRIAYRLPINTASASELSALPGVGPKLAQTLVEHRAAHGPFTNAQSLQAVKGIGALTAQRIHEWVRY